MKKVKLAILASHPIQYYTPLYKLIASDASIDLTVVYMTRAGVDSYYDPGFGIFLQWDTPLLDGYKYQFLSSRTEAKTIELSVASWLVRERPDVIILHGYGNATNLFALSAAKLMRMKVMLTGDSRFSSKVATSGLRYFVKKQIMRVVDKFITIGTSNSEYYQAFNVPVEKLHFAPFSVDNKFFELTPDKKRLARTQLRESLGVPDSAVVILFASKLVARKRAKDLIEAFRNIAADDAAVWLWFAGSGPESESLKRDARGLERIRFLGFQNQGALPQLYAASDVFVLPSEDEPWGLVINEVMAAGLPVVISDDVGSGRDLVENKNTGLIYPIGDIEKLAENLRLLASNRDLRETLGRNAQALISDWSLSKASCSFIEAVHCLEAEHTN